ncbi:MAG: M23 family metallopeptidase [Candidatus Eisenbacteria bacterium]
MPPRSYSVIVAPSDGSRSYHLQVSRRAVIAAGILLCILGAAFVFLLATRGALIHRVRNWEELRARSENLEREAARVAELEEEVSRLREMDRRIRGLMGLPEPRATIAGGEGREAASEEPSEAEETLDLPDAIVPDEETRTRLENALRSRRGALRWPLDGFVSSSFGEGRSEGGIHPGIDIAAARNTPVEAPLAGNVVDAGQHPVYGNVVVIDHGDGLVTVYGHNARILVREGERVREGDTVALVGSTGQSSAPHLHFETRMDGYAFDPLYLLKPKVRS